MWNCLLATYYVTGQLLVTACDLRLNSFSQYEALNTICAKLYYFIYMVRILACTAVSSTSVVLKFYFIGLLELISW